MWYDSETHGTLQCLFLCERTHTYSHTHMRTHLCAHAHVHTHIRELTCAYIHPNTHTHTHGLTQAAFTRKEVWSGIEQDIARFVDDASRRRHALDPMPSSQRALAHELAEAYGLATISMGWVGCACVCMSVCINARLCGCVCRSRCCVWV